MLFFEKKEVRIAKKLLKFEQKGGKLLGAECYYLATFFYDNSNIPAVLNYLQKGVEINSLECRISYWRVFLKEHYKEIGWKRQDLANYIHSLAQECDHPEVCWDDTLELARKKAQLHDAFAMNIKAANLGSYHAIRELFAYCEVRPEYEAQALYWLYKALQHFPKDGSVKDSEVMELHLKFANRFPGDDVQYIIKAAADEGCASAVADMKWEDYNWETLKPYIDLGVDNAIPSVVYRYCCYSLDDTEDSAPVLETMEAFAKQGYRDFILSLADIYSGKIEKLKSFANHEKALYYNELALYYNYPNAISFFVEHTEGVHKDFFKFILKETKFLEIS